MAASPTLTSGGSASGRRAPAVAARCCRQRDCFQHLAAGLQGARGLLGGRRGLTGRPRACRFAAGVGRSALAPQHRLQRRARRWAAAQRVAARAPCTPAWCSPATCAEVDASRGTPNSYNSSMTIGNHGLAQLDSCPCTSWIHPHCLQGFNAELDRPRRGPVLRPACCVSVVSAVCTLFRPASPLPHTPPTPCPVLSLASLRGDGKGPRLQLAQVCAPPRFRPAPAAYQSQTRPIEGLIRAQLQGGPQASSRGMGTGWVVE